MIAQAPCVRAAADQLPPSSHQKPHATATRSLAPQHPETREEPLRFEAKEACGPRLPPPSIQAEFARQFLRGKTNRGTLDVDAQPRAGWRAGLGVFLGAPAKTPITRG